MPVYLMTVRAYRSWCEDHAEGYVQHGEGRNEPNAALARWRAQRAAFDGVRFGTVAQGAIHDVAVMIAAERGFRLHACATCPTHVHVVVSFEKPVCTCAAVVAALRLCGPKCESRKAAEEVLVRMKRKMGQRVAREMGTVGRPWFSRGWDLVPVRGRVHFEYLMREYFPKHENEGGVVRVYFRLKPKSDAIGDDAGGLG